MKKLVSMISMFALGLTLLSGCQAPSSNNTNTTADETKADTTAQDATEAQKSSDKVTITYALWDTGQLPVMQTLADEFEKENPNIHIEIQTTAWKDYWTKLETTVTAGNGPDVFWLNIPRATDYIKNDIIIPLDDLGIDKSKFPETHIEAYTRDGKLYGIPRDFDTVGLYYNKTLFEEAGVPLPTDQWTWDDMKDAAAKLTNKEKGVYGIIASADWQGGYYEAIYQNGSSPFTADGKSNFSDPAVIEALNYWYSFVKDGSSPNAADLANTPAKDMLLSGKVAMIADGSWNATIYFNDDYGKANLDVAMLPKGKVNGTTSNSLGNVIYSKSKHIDEAKKWVTFLSSERANQEVAAAGIVIPSYSGTQDEWINAFPDKNLKAFVDSVKFATHLPNIPNFSAAQNFEYEYLVPVWNGEGTVEDACKIITEKQNEVLSQQ